MIVPTRPGPRYAGVVPGGRASLDARALGALVALVMLAVAPLALGPSDASARQAARPEVVILTTGGTIASRPGADLLAGVDLVGAVPELLDHASVRVEEVVRIGSSRMTPDVWLRVGRRIDALFAEEPELAGVVVTHGTDTMEETAWFLHLTVRHDRPVVLTGSMRSATDVSADGPANLVDAVRTAVHPDARGRGVLLVLNDEINGARDAWKTDNQRVQTFQAPGLGVLGWADPDTVVFHRRPSRRHTAASEFDLSGVEALPEVPLVADYAGFDGSAVTAWLDRGVAGIVVETFAGGRMSAGALRGVSEAVARGVPVVVASRVPGGRIPGDPLVEGSILARDLPAHKARVLLMVALGAGVPPDDLARVFRAY